MTSLRKTLSELKIAETPVASLEGNGAFFALLPEELVYRNKKEIHRVDLLALTRIHSENTKILHFDTNAGRLFSASLEPFEMSEVKTFFQELGELTNAVKAGKKTPNPAPEPEAIVIGDPPKVSSAAPAEEITPQQRQQMRTQVSESVAAQKKPVWAQNKSSTPVAPAPAKPVASAVSAMPEAPTKEAEKSEKADKVADKPAKSKPATPRLSEEEATLALWRWPKRLRLLGSVLLVLSLVALGFALWRGLSTSSILFVAMVAILFSLGGDLLGWWLAKNTQAPASNSAESSRK